MIPRKQPGFTIVELLIVIVVIGILAAITIVAYNGMQQRARESTLKSDLANAAKKMATDNTLNGSYALTEGAVDGGKGLQASSGTSYQFHSTGTTYCITGTNGPTSFKISDTSTTAAQGGCPGDGVGGVAAVTNYAPNPTAAGASVAAFGYAGSPVTATRSIASDQSHHSTTSLKTVITGASGQTGAMARPATNTLRVNTGEKLSWSFWVYSTKAGSLVAYVEGAKVADGTYTGASAGTVTIPANTWTRVSGIYTAPLDMYANQVGGYNLSVVAGDTVWFDEFMIAKANAPLNYADGESTDWQWNGGINASSSTGPAS